MKDFVSAFKYLCQGVKRSKPAYDEEEVVVTVMILYPSTCSDLLRFCPSDDSDPDYVKTFRRLRAEADARLEAP
jgi:hypothetical protein